MAVSGLLEIPYIPDSPDAITGELTAASGGVFIELWDENGVAASLQSSGCNQMGNTDFYAWPVSGIPAIPSVRSFYHWRMTAVSGSSDVPEGDVVLFAPEGNGGQMPNLNDKSSYIIQN